MIKHNLFPTLITETNNFLSSIQCNDIYKYIVNNKKLLNKHPAITTDQSGSSHSSISNFLMQVQGDVPSCYNIINTILDTSKDYLKTSSFSAKNRLDNSWFNIQTKDSMLKEHTHPLSVLSGVIFIKSDKNSSKVYFENPNPFLKITSFNEGNNPHSSKSFSFAATPGTMLLFPAWLTHGSNNVANKSKERIVLSFNIV
jgi:uncharacterized protein (TIGR02466 family)